MPVPGAHSHKTLLSYIPGHKLQTSAPARCSWAKAALFCLPFSSGFILAAAVFIFVRVFDLQADSYSPNKTQNPGRPLTGPEYLYLKAVKGFDTEQATQSPNLPSPSSCFAPGCADANRGQGRCRDLGGAAPGAACHQAGLCCRVALLVARNRERRAVPQPPR